MRVRGRGGRQDGRASKECRVNRNDAQHLAMVHTGDVRVGRVKEVVATSSNPLLSVENGTTGHGGKAVRGGRRGVGTKGHGGTQGLGVVGVE